MKREPLFETEAQLCEDFTAWAQGQGYTVYPETCGYDLVLVDERGNYIGVEAKLKFNIKVFEQAMPSLYSGWGIEYGPEHRCILLGESCRDGYRHILRYIGIGIFEPQRVYPHRRPAKFDLDAGGSYSHRAELHDWNPEKRLELPEYVPTVAAGVPSPMTLSKWKIGALKVIAHLQVHGEITRKQMLGYGINPSRWLSVDQWLIRKKPGTYQAGNLPRFDEQNPEVYSNILGKMKSGEIKNLFGSAQKKQGALL